MPKNILTPFKVISSGSMTGTAVITSAATFIQYLDNISIQLVWVGAAVGTFDVQGSLDHTESPLGNVTNAGTWTSITLTPAPAAAGSSSNILINMDQLSFPWIRVVYTNSSSTGTLQAYISGKEI